jgi:dihydroorotate dehydrogenase electron transfer subunit
MNRPGTNQFVAVVEANDRLCRDHYGLVLKSDEFPATRPGQFIQILCRKLDDQPGQSRDVDWMPGMRIEFDDPDLAQPLATLRRPFSLAGRRGAEIDIIHRVVGLGTRFMSELKVGDEVGILGPLGNEFTLPQADEFGILVGGGVGIPPMIYLASEFGDRAGVAFAGALTRDLMPLTVGSANYEVGEFWPRGIPTVLCTDDGTLGYRGFVTQALEAFLDDRLDSALARKMPDGACNLKPVIYTCGPELMMKRVAEIALTRGIACQVAVERAMACGMGTCQSCCIRVRKPDPSAVPLPVSDWCYRLTCTDGPIFQASQLLW